jgi:mono/diheme cytochrome c family protein
MGKFVFGLIIGAILVPLGVYAYFVTGMAPVATSAQAMPFEKMMANKALHARLEKEMPKGSPPVAADDATYSAGAQVYLGHCGMCHGLPNRPKPPIAKGEYPAPPQLFMGHGVTDDPAQETYWKVTNGIRLTGMPAYSSSLSDTEIWQVSVMLANADKLPDSVKQMLANPHPPGGAPPNANTPGGTPPGMAGH